MSESSGNSSGQGFCDELRIQNLLVESAVSKILTCKVHIFSFSVLYQAEWSTLLDIKRVSSKYRRSGVKTLREKKHIAKDRVDVQWHVHPGHTTIPIR